MTDLRKLLKVLSEKEKEELSKLINEYKREADGCYSQEVLSAGKKKKRLSEREAVDIALKEARDGEVVPLEDVFKELHKILEKAKKNEL